MISALAIVGSLVAIFVAGLAVLGVVILAQATDARAANHPGGRTGLMLDRALGFSAPVMIALLMISSWISATLEAPASIYAIAVVVVGAAGLWLAPISTRAQARVKACGPEVAQ